MTTTTVPETLRAAADHIEKVGLHKGTFFKRVVPSVKALPLSERPCCTLGAIGYETGAFVPDPEASWSYTSPDLYPGPVDSDGEPLADPDAMAVVQRQQDAENYLRSYLQINTDHNSVPGWNDDYATTQEGVVRTLRAAADAYVVEGV